MCIFFITSPVSKFALFIVVFATKIAEHADFKANHMASLPVGFSSSGCSRIVVIDVAINHFSSTVMKDH